MLIFYFIMLLAFFSPGLMIPGIAQLWPADIALLAVLSWRIFSPPPVRTEYRRYVLSKLLLPVIVFMIYLTVITFLTLWASQNVPARSAVFSLIGRFRPLLFFVFIIPYAGDRQKLDKLFRFLIILFVLQCIVVICQKFNVAGINNWYTIKFRPIDNQVSYIYSMGARTIGTIGNPNSLGSTLR